MRVQRFATLADIDAADPTIEEREEYEAPVELGMVMFAGVDYGAILELAAGEADVIVWDGGNNDLPFFAPDLLVVVTDALRPDQELSYHPGETNLRMADVVVVNKIDSGRAGLGRSDLGDDRGSQPDGDGGASRITGDPRPGTRPPRTASAGGRRRPDGHARGHAVRGRNRRRPSRGRGNDRRPSLVGGGIDRRYVRALPGDRRGAPGHGLLTPNSSPSSAARSAKSTAMSW